MAEGLIKPSRWHYLLSPLVFAAGIGIFALLLVKGIGAIDHDLLRIVFPGKAALHLEKPGSYTVFYENESVVNGRSFSTSERLGSVNCALKESGSGAPISLHRPSTSTSYKTAEVSGRSVLEFELKSAGDYEMTCDYAAGQQGDQVVFAVGPGMGARIWLTVLPALLAFFTGLVLAIGIAIWTYLKRKMAKAQFRTQTLNGRVGQELLSPPNS